MSITEVKTLVGAQGVVYTYRFKSEGEVMFTFPSSLWGATISSHELKDRIQMVRTEGRDGRFIVRVSPRKWNEAKRNVGFHVTDGLSCWFVEVRYSKRGEYLTHVATYVAKKPHELGIVRTAELIRPSGASREHQLSLRDYGPTVMIEGSAELTMEKVTNDGVEITSRGGYLFATFTGPQAGRASRTIRINDATGRTWALTVHFNPFYERYELVE